MPVHSPTRDRSAPGARGVDSPTDRCTAGEDSLMGPGHSPPPDREPIRQLGERGAGLSWMGEGRPRAPHPAPRKSQHRAGLAGGSSGIWRPRRALAVPMVTDACLLGRELQSGSEAGPQRAPPSPTQIMAAFHLFGPFMLCFCSCHLDQRIKPFQRLQIQKHRQLGGLSAVATHAPPLIVSLKSDPRAVTQR